MNMVATALRSFPNYALQEIHVQVQLKSFAVEREHGVFFPANCK
jgi:hypothetical protein